MLEESDILDRLVRNDLTKKVILEKHLHKMRENVLSKCRGPEEGAFLACVCV